MSLNETKKFLEENSSQKIFIIGGEFIYNSLKDYVETMYVSIIKDYQTGDKKFPLREYLESSWKISNIEVFKTFGRITYKRA